MQKMTLTKLRSDLFQIADRILASGETLEIERNGQTLILTSKEKTSKLARLSKRKLINGDAESLAELKVGTWQEAENLR